jgi:hypothetical protein
MANPELVRTLDYILNRCDEGAIDAVAEAVVRRRRDLAYFGSGNIPDPRKMARELSSEMNIGGAIEGLQRSVRDMAVRIIKEEAPELTKEQADALAKAWIPEPPTGTGDGKKAPADYLRYMIDQFVSFSTGAMPETEDRELRSEMGAWPERYWKSFPPVVRQIATEFLNGKISEKEFDSKIKTALSMGY